MDQELKEKLEKEGRVIPVAAFMGSDGSGKSTIMTVLASILGYDIIDTPTDIYRQGGLRQHIMETAGHVQDLLYNTASVLDAANTIKRYKTKGSGLFVGRYLVDTAVYHSLKTGIPVENVFPGDLIERMAEEISWPDITIYLQANPADVLNRMLARGNVENVVYADARAKELAERAVSEGKNTTDLDDLFYSGLKLRALRGNSIIRFVNASPGETSRERSIAHVASDVSKLISPSGYSIEQILPYIK